MSRRFKYDAAHHAAQIDLWGLLVLAESLCCSAAIFPCVSSLNYEVWRVGYNLTHDA